MANTLYSIALKLSLDGVNQLKQQFGVVTQEIKQVHSGIKQSFGQMKELATSTLGQAFTLGGMVMGIRSAIVTGMEFEDTFLRATAKIPGEVRKGTKEFKELEKLTLSLGASTEFSTSQVSQGLDFWAKAGKNTQEIMTLLPKSLDFATASGLDLARASDIISDNLGIFNLNTQDTNQLMENTSRIMDNMAKTSTMTNTSIEELFETSKYAGNIFTTAGQSMETFNAATAVLADNSIKGGVAGTQLRAIMSRLASPTAAAQQQLSSLGVSIRDSQGNMRDFADILTDLSNSTQAMGNTKKLAIFKELAGQEAMNGLNALTQGTAKLQQYRTALQQSSGTTDTLAAIFRSDTKANLANFTSALEGIAISIFRFLQPALNILLQILTGIICYIKDFIGDSLILKGVFIGLVLAIIATFALLTAKVLAVIAGVAILVKGFQWLYNNCQSFKKAIETVATITKSFFSWFSSNLKRMLNWGNFTEAFSTIVSFMGNLLKNLLRGILNMLLSIGKTILAVILKPFELILKAVAKIPGKIGRAAKAGLESIRGLQETNDEQPTNLAQRTTPLVVKSMFTRPTTDTGQEFFSHASNQMLSSSPQMSRSTLDINILPPKGFSTGFNLQNNFNNNLAININGGQ